MAAIAATAAGHPNIRATHAKTLELTRDADIGPAATCVVGVATAIDAEALAELNGHVALTLTAGGQTAVVRGRLNPAFRPTDPLVVRRDPAVVRNAVVIGADHAAEDLPRPLVAELAEPGARIEVAVEELTGEPAPGVLVVDPQPAEAAPTDAGAVAEALAAGRRVTLRADLAADAAARAAIEAAHAAGHTVLPAPDLAPVPAAMAVAGLAEAETVAGGAALRPREVELTGPSLVTGVPAVRVPKWLRKAARSGLLRGVIGLDLGTPREQYVPWQAGGPIEIPGARGRTATLVLAQDSRTPETSSVARPEPRTSR